MQTTILAVEPIVGRYLGHALSKALPEISKSEVDLFKKIVENPKLLGRVMRSFNL
jgi:hypothetical protein